MSTSTGHSSMQNQNDTSFFGRDIIKFSFLLKKYNDNLVVMRRRSIFVTCQFLVLVWLIMLEMVFHLKPKSHQPNSCHVIFCQIREHFSRDKFEIKIFVGLGHLVIQSSASVISFMFHSNRFDHHILYS